MGKSVIWTPEDFIAMHDISRALARGDRAKARVLLRKRYGSELGEAIFRDEAFVGLARRRRGQPLFGRESTADQEPSQREIEVLSEAAEGLTNEQIGKKLFLSPETIKTHKRRVFAKLRAANIAQAISIAYDKGLLKRKDGK